MAWRCLLYLLLLSLCASGCARLGAGQGRWRLVQTEHFQLYTDLAEQQAEAQAVQLERLLAALEQAGWEAKGSLPLKLNVVMFRREIEFERFGKHKFNGYLTDLLFEPWMVMPAPLHGSDLSVAAHELTHYIAFQAMQNQPRWFSEGIASYFESAHFADSGGLVIGSVPRGRFDALRMYGIHAPSKLFSGVEAENVSQFYGSAWLLVHLLMTEHGDAFVNYQKALARGLDHKHAYAEAFPRLSPEQLDAALAAYVVRGEYATFELPIRTPAVTTRTRTLSRADEHALQALLWASCPACSPAERGRAKDSLKLALSADASQVQAASMRVLSLHQRSSEALVEARTLTQTHPNHWLAWMTLGAVATRAGGRLPESGTLTKRLLELAPTQAFAWLVVAFQYYKQGARDEALQATLRAKQLQPSKPEVLAVCAALFLELGECGRAAATLGLLEANAHASLAEEPLKELRARSAKCRARVANH